MGVDNVIEEADLLDVSYAGFTREKVKPCHDTLSETELSVDRLAESRRDRLAVRQPPRKEENQLPFELCNKGVKH